MMTDCPVCTCRTCLAVRATRAQAAADDALPGAPATYAHMAERPSVEDDAAAGEARQAEAAVDSKGMDMGAPAGFTPQFSGVGTRGRGGGAGMQLSFLSPSDVVTRTQLAHAAVDLRTRIESIIDR